MNSVAAVWAKVKRTRSQQQSGNVAQEVLVAMVGNVGHLLTSGG